MNKESVWEYPRPPRAEPTSKRIGVYFGGELVAETSRAVQVLETSKSAGGQKRVVGRRADRNEHGGLSLAEAGFGGAVRIHGMDARQSPQAFPLYRFVR